MLTIMSKQDLLTTLSIDANIQFQINGCKKPVIVRNKKFQNQDFSRYSFKHIKFINCEFINCNFNQTYLQVGFRNCLFKTCSFDYASINNTDFEKNKFVYSTFNFSSFYQVYSKANQFRNCSFTKACIKRSILDDDCFTNINFKNTYWADCSHTCNAPHPLASYKPLRPRDFELNRVQFNSCVHSGKYPFTM